MRNIPDVGTEIWAHVVFPGMIVQTLDDGRGAQARIDVQRVTDEHYYLILDDGNSRALRIDHDRKVKVIGYFNPEPEDTLRDRDRWWTEEDHRRITIAASL